MKIIKKLRSLTIATAVAASLGVSSVSAQELKLATFIPPQHHLHKNLFTWFAKEVESRSNGELTVKIYPSGQLGAGPVQQYKRVLEGVADITFGLPAYTPKVFPKTMMIIPPGMSDSAAESTQRLWGVYDKHLASEYKNVKLLGLWTVAGIGLASKDKAIRTLEDLKGLKYVPYGAMTTPIVEEMGGVPVQMPVTEFYTALSTGTVDAVTATANNMVAPWNLLDVSKYWIDNIPVAHTAFFLAMNKNSYAKLPEKHRTIIDELAGEALSLRGAISFDDTDAKSLEMMKQKSDKFEWITISDEERQKMDDAVKRGLEKVFENMKAQGLPNAKEVYNDINS
ncbi:MAG: TRAP transporter substrate-binding protein [Gammaproteobacteria bacterium]|nr:MAG: TRAP transporter substrate-binding protein [Gammaproteobacteria bacterium]